MNRKLYKYYNLNSSYVVDNLKKQEITFSSTIKLNDAYEGLCYVGNATGSDILFGEEYKKSKESIIKHEEKTWDKNTINYRRVCCFTRDYKNELMWAHYSDSYKGICVEYDYKDVVNHSDKVSKIKYSFLKPKWDSNDIEGSRDTVLLHKSRKWKYEKEIRALLKITDEDIENASGIEEAKYINCKKGIAIKDNDIFFNNNGVASKTKIYVN